MLLLVVLPLQGVAQLVAGVHGQRHVHTGTVQVSAASTSVHHDSGLTRLLQPLKALVNQLHASQDARLKQPQLNWVMSQGPAAELHEHGGVAHEHSHDQADVLEVGDPADDTEHGGATAFLAWLPAALAVPAGEGSDRPAVATHGWRDRVVAPPLTPPRG